MSLPLLRSAMTKQWAMATTFLWELELQAQGNGEKCFSSIPSSVEQQGGSMGHFTLYPGVLVFLLGNVS